MKLWSAQDFGMGICSREITIKRNKQELSLHNTSVWPDMSPFQISNYFQLYGSCGLHKISDSGDAST